MVGTIFPGQGIEARRETQSAHIYHGGAHPMTVDVEGWRVEVNAEWFKQEVKKIVQEELRFEHDRVIEAMAKLRPDVLDELRTVLEAAETVKRLEGL
jgi:methyl coenzyme M reductase subunit D